MKNRNKFFLLGAGALLIVSFQNFTSATGESPGNSAPHRMSPPKDMTDGNRKFKIESDHLLVKFKDTVSLDKQDEILAHHNGARVENVGEGKLGALHRVHVVPGQEAQTLARLKASEDVEFAEYNEMVPADTLSNDSMQGSQWSLNNISLPTAWSSSTGPNAIIVAILDSGVYTSHPDLIQNVVPGYNVVDNNTDVSDIHGHGTAVAGVAIADTNNGVGVASPCWNCRLMPVRVAELVNGSLYAYFSKIASGMTWASDHGAKVMNISYAQMYTSSSIASAATYVKNHGGLAFGALGNDSALVSTNVAADLIFVGATNSSNQKSSFSNYGPVMTLSAPGEYILTTNKAGSYSNWNGTSFASPLAAGVAALVWSTNPSLTPADVRSILIQSVDDLGAVGKDDNFGYGKVNAAKAVQKALSYTTTTTTVTTTTTTTLVPAPTTVTDTTAPSVSITSPAAGATVSRTVTVGVRASDNVGVTKVSLYVDGALIGSSTSAPFSVNWNTKKTSVGSHTITVKAYDARGNVGTSAAVTVNVSR
jgi:subtilisin family serine protease